MQIRLSAQNEELLEEYRKLCRELIPSYNEADGSIVNGILTDKLRQEIQRMKKGKKA